MSGLLILVFFVFLQRFFSHREHKDDIQHGLNHNKYMVTDNAVYIGRQCIMCFYTKLFFNAMVQHLGK